MIVVLALVDAPPRPAPRGIRFVRAAGLWAAIADTRAQPKPTMTALRAHDARIRRLAKQVRAILPVRFGTLVDSPKALADTLRPHTKALLAALTEVRDCEQMTIRVFADADANADADGTAYLHRKRVAELDPLRAQLKPLVRDERTIPHSSPPLRASIHHLIPRGTARRYRAAVRRAGLSVRAVVRGPFPPWAFAPEVGP